MKKTLLVLCGAFMLCGSLMAADTYKSIELTRVDDSKLIVAIENDMEASIVDGNLNLTCDKGDFAIPVSELKNWIFSQADGDSEIWTGIENVESDLENVAIIYEAGSITLKNVKEGSQIIFAGIDGRVYSSGYAVGGSDYVIDTNGIVPGVYVLAYGNRSLKIALR